MESATVVYVSVWVHLSSFARVVRGVDRSAVDIFASESCQGPHRATDRNRSYQAPIERGIDVARVHGGVDSGHFARGVPSRQEY